MYVRSTQDDRNKALELLKHDKTGTVTLNQLESRVIAERLGLPFWCVWGVPPDADGGNRFYVKNV